MAKIDARLVHACPAFSSWASCSWARSSGGEAAIPSPSSLAGGPSKSANEPRERGGQVVASSEGGATNLQSSRRQRPDDRDPCDADAGPARSHQPVNVRAGAVARRAMGIERRRAHPHAAPSPGRRLVRRDAVHVGGRPLLSARRLRPERQEPGGQQPHDRRAADRGDGPGRFDRRPDLPVSLRPRHSAARHAADPAEAQARSRRCLPARSRRRGERRRRPARSSARARSSCASISPVSGSSSIAIPATGARRRTAMRCRISIASCWSSCRIRTRSCCGCSPARPTSRTASCARTTTSRCAAPRQKAS